jgi:hypothetical protein
MRACHSGGPVVWTLEPSELTATVPVRKTEAEAEGVARVVCSSLGFATNGASETYVVFAVM